MEVAAAVIAYLERRRRAAKREKTVSTEHKSAYDPDYERFLTRLADECYCCERCYSVPCASLQAGGSCEQWCTCEEGDPNCDGDERTVG